MVLLQNPKAQERMHGPMQMDHYGFILSLILLHGFATPLSNTSVLPLITPLPVMDGMCCLLSSYSICAILCFLSLYGIYTILWMLEKSKYEFVSRHFDASKRSNLRYFVYLIFLVIFHIDSVTW